LILLKKSGSRIRHLEQIECFMNNNDIDWKSILRLLYISRFIDEIEETELYPQKKVLYQFSARGHDLAQILLASHLTHPHDAVGAYYRSRPMLLGLGLSIEDAFASPMGKCGGFSDGRDIGVVCNLPSKKSSNGVTVLPMSGDVGSQYTPISGWAQAIKYREEVLGDKAFKGAIATVLGGEGSVATNGFWAALTIATTLKLPMLFYIEDNGYAISVIGDKQTPGGNIANNLASFKNLYILDGDGTNPEQALRKINESVNYVRSSNGPVLLRLTVPRLSGHSGQDTQGYKPEKLKEKENKNDPLDKLRSFLVPNVLSNDTWRDVESSANDEVRAALQAALSREEPDISKVLSNVFYDRELQTQGGLAVDGVMIPKGTSNPSPEPTRTNMLTAIRRTLEHELKINPRVLVYGEDVGAKGGVHAATMGLQETFGESRVFDTSLSEEGIIGRAVGMALCGLMPVAEIQFRKYADPATEQLNNCGTIRWRTANQFAAPIVVRMPGGFSKCGDPWHSVCSEVIWAHAIGWQVAFPSHAENAVGLLRSALRSNNPTIFFEHRNLYDNAWARRPYPGDDYVLEFGKASIVQAGREVTVVTWGAMVERCEEAARQIDVSCEIIDLQTIVPWDKQTVLESIKKTRRCVIVHEDGITAGFGSEIAAVIAKEAFFHLDAPIDRVCTPDIPIPYNVSLMNAVIPSIERIANAITNTIEC
jgi:2-oxoisovalerate dehydrogenase E1 component